MLGENNGRHSSSITVPRVAPIPLVVSCLNLERYILYSLAYKNGDSGTKRGRSVGPEWGLCATREDGT